MQYSGCRVNVINFVPLLLRNDQVSRKIVLRGHHLVVIREGILPANALEGIYQISGWLSHHHFAKCPVVVEHPVSKQEVSPDLIVLGFHFFELLLVVSLAGIRRQDDIHEFLNQLFQVLVFVVVRDSVPDSVLVQSPLEERNRVQESTGLCKLIKNFKPYIVRHHHNFHAKSKGCFVPIFTGDAMDLAVQLIPVVVKNFYFSLPVDELPSEFALDDRKRSHEDPEFYIHHVAAYDYFE